MAFSRVELDLVGAQFTEYSPWISNVKSPPTENFSLSIYGWLFASYLDFSIPESNAINSERQMLFGLVS